MTKVKKVKEPKKQKLKTRRVYLEMKQDMYKKALSLSEQLQFTTLNAFIRHLVRERLIQAGKINAAISTDQPAAGNEIDDE